MNTQDLITRFPSSADLLALLGLERRNSSDAMLYSLATFGAGIAVGAALALLLTPKSGEEMRSRLGDQVSRWREGLRGVRGAAES